MRQLFNLILLFAAIITGLQTHAQVVRPPIEANTVRALNELDAQQTLKFQGDALVKSEMAYIEWADDCFRFRRITTGAGWSDWLCIDDGEQTTIGVNAQSAFEIISNAINFKVQNKHTVLQSDAGNNFVFKGNVILGENFTALGFGAGQSGYDSLVAGGDTILVPAFDNQFDNVILIGHGAQERAPNTAVIGDSSLVRIWTAAAVDASALEIKGDSVFLRHLVNLVEADSGKIAMHNGSGVVWIPQKADSIQINGEWVKLGESFSFSDSIQVNGVWVHLGGSFTTPDAQNLSWDSETGSLGISGGTGVDLDGRYLQSETPQNLSWDSETGVLGIDGGTGVDLDGRYLVPPTASDGQMMIYASGSWYATAPIDERVSVINSEGTKSAPALLYADDFSVTQVGGAVDDWVVRVKPDSLTWNSGTRELSILGSNTVTIEDECACSGATGSFYSKEGKLIIVENGIIKSIGEQVIGGYWTFKTTSTSSTWTPELVSNSGTILHWDVTGAVVASADANYPVFDFSNVGEKVVTVTSADGMDGLHSLDLRNKNITEFNSDRLTNLAGLNLGDNNLVEFDVTGMVGLVGLSIDGNQLPSSVVNSILDSLISIGNTSGTSLDIRNQTGGGCGDLAKIQALDAIWDDVLADTCVVFPEVTIGTQTWMAVNLDIDDGLGGIYAYDDNEANVATYGRLYTWDAAVRVAASVEGWHLPSDAEWTTLIDYLGGDEVAGGKLKETGTTHWASPNTGATNETGFTALPGGCRYDDGTFDGIGGNGIWWSATEYDADLAWGRYMGYNYSDVDGDLGSKEFGYSVRLIKNTP